MYTETRPTTDDLTRTEDILKLLTQDGMQCSYIKRQSQTFYFQLRKPIKKNKPKKQHSVPAYDREHIAAPAYCKISSLDIEAQKFINIHCHLKYSDMEQFLHYYTVINPIKK